MTHITCTRLLGKEGEACRTCGRMIVVTHRWPNGDYALQHEGPTMGQRLHDLNEARRPR